MENKISDKKFFSMLMIELFGMTSLTLPAIVVRLSGKNGLPVLFLASAGLFLAARYFLWGSEKDGVTYRDRITSFPEPVRILYTGIYVVRFFLHGLFLTILFLSLIQEILLPEQSRIFILIPFLILLLMTVGKTLAVRGNILEILFPYIFIPFLIVLFLALFRLDYGSLKGQLWIPGEGPDWLSAYGVFCFYQPVEFLLFLAPARTKENRKKGFPVVLACLLAAVIKILFFGAVIGMFGVVRTGEKLWSSLYVMQSVRLPGNFVERLDILFLIFWIFSIFALCSGYLFYSEWLLPDGIKKGYPYLFVGLLALFSAGNTDPDRIFELFLTYKMWIDVPLSLLLPLLAGISWKRSGRNGWKRAGLLVLLLGSGALIMSGCQKKTDIEDKSYVVLIGVEKGENHRWNVGFESADISRSTGSGGGVQKGRTVFFEADTLLEAEEKEQNSDDKKMDYGHLKALVLSAECVGERDLWENLMEELRRMQEFSGTTLIFFTDEKMADYMDQFKEGENALGDYLDRMTENHNPEKQWEYTLAELLKDEAENVSGRSVPMLSLSEGGITLMKKEWKELSGTSALSEQVLRFHIRAESDDPEDQEFKNRIKDRILPKLQELFAGCSSKEECMETALENLKKISRQVKTACEEEGNSCENAVYLCQEAFPVRAYGDMIFPSGTYDALRIDLGQGKGANWWCMIYPSLCLTDGVIEGVTPETRDYLGENLEEEDYDSLFFTNRKVKYHVKWKFLEKIEEFFGEK